MPTFNDHGKEAYGRHCWKKEENADYAGNRRLLLLPQCFLPYKKIHHLSQNEIVVCKRFQFGQG